MAKSGHAMAIVAPLPQGDIADSEHNNQLSACQVGAIIDRLKASKEDVIHISNKSEKNRKAIFLLAETILTADPKDHARYHRLIEQSIMGIFQACSDQEIINNRIDRLIETFKFIEQKTINTPRVQP